MTSDLDRDFKTSGVHKLLGVGAAILLLSIVTYSMLAPKAAPKLDPAIGLRISTDLLHEEKLKSQASGLQLQFQQLSQDFQATEKDIAEQTDLAKKKAGCTDCVLDREHVALAPAPKTPEKPAAQVPAPPAKPAGQK